MIDGKAHHAFTHSHNWMQKTMNAQTPNTTNKTTTKHYAKLGTQSFLKSVSSTMLFVFIGKVLGLVKQAVFAAIFGTSIGMDLFFSSYLFISGVSALFSAFNIVLLNSYNKASRVQDKNRLISGVLKCSVVAAAILSALIIVSSNMISDILAPGFDASEKQRLAHYISCLSPALILCAIQYPLTAILDSRKKFFAGKSLPIILNTTLILSAFISAHSQSIAPLLIATLASFAVQVVISRINLHGDFSFVKEAQGIRDTKVRKILKLAAPLLIGNALIDINNIADKSIASSLPAGSISATTYAASIYDIVAALVINTIAAVFYSYISSMKASGRIGDIKKHTRQIIRALSLCLVPITIFVIMFAHNIVSLFYERGAFGADSVHMTAMVVVGYAVGFVPAMINDVLSKVHYTFDDTKSPMISSGIAIILNVLISIILSQRIGIIGIALGTSISNLTSAVILSITIRKHFGATFYRSGQRIYILKTCIAAIISAGVGIMLTAATNGLGNIISLAVGGCGILGSFFIALYFMKINIIKELAKISRII